MRLYRAGDCSFCYQPTSFAVDIDDAREYLDNPGFGGDTLYYIDIDIDDDKVLDLSEERDQVEALSVLTDIHMGAVTADYMLSHGHVVDKLIEMGYTWVCLMDTYPENCETWTWLGNGEDLDLEEVE